MILKLILCAAGLVYATDIENSSNDDDNEYFSHNLKVTVIGEENKQSHTVQLPIRPHPWSTQFSTVRSKYIEFKTLDSTGESTSYLEEDEYNDMLSHCTFYQVKEDTDRKKGYFLCDLKTEQKRLMKMFKKNTFFGIWSFYKAYETVMFICSNELSQVPKEIRVENVLYFPYYVSQHGHKWHTTVSYARHGQKLDFEYQHPNQRFLTHKDEEEWRAFQGFQQQFLFPKITPGKTIGDYDNLMQIKMQKEFGFAAKLFLPKLLKYKQLTPNVAKQEILTEEK